MTYVSLNVNIWPHPLRKNHSIDAWMIMKSISYETVYVCHLWVIYIINSSPSDIFKLMMVLEQLTIISNCWSPIPQRTADPWCQWLRTLENVPSQNCPQKFPVPKLTKLIQAHYIHLWPIPIRTAHVSETVTKFVNTCTKLIDKIVQIVMNMWLNCIKSQSSTVWPPIALPSTGRLA